MKTMISYKNCLIRSESFQFGQNGGWIPRYAIMHQGADRDSTPAPSHHDRLDKTCWTESEADEFAVQDAKRRVDNNLTANSAGTELAETQCESDLLTGPPDPGWTHIYLYNYK